MVYKWCVVPKCTNTSINSPQTLFVSVPTDCKRRKKWLLLARRDPKGISSTSNVFMCEDHFDMEKDTINYMQYKMGFSKKILLTEDAVPTKFHCQEDRKRPLSDAGLLEEHMSRGKEWIWSPHVCKVKMLLKPKLKAYKKMRV
ncbi:unnamed protein product [Acanthoscelides obtectus]|uniref:THAP-type domain-containing protein n=1 Tax=Acanthoscelides obtectus TaxID=200917 RepID=A0A9P0VPG2_ACAOB|nr:unnamed protein product [Acanthoscelides obtectus]CAK1687486.1 hypothetical protein AOBTE_LOCUS36266 [Acanthoscelides obtectus]